MSLRLQVALMALVSAVLLALPALELLPVTWLEAVASVSYAWSVWLLAHNQPLGWWVGLVGVVTYGFVYWGIPLYGEVALCGFYFVTSLQAIWIWWRGGPQGGERPVGRVPRAWLLASGVVMVVATLATWQLLDRAGSQAPFWDALTTIVSVTAHFYLMLRFVESWPLWIAVDVIYVPLFFSRGLYLTSGLYVVFLVLAVGGLREFRRLHAAQEGAKPA